VRLQLLNIRLVKPIERVEEGVDRAPPVFVRPVFVRVVRRWSLTWSTARVAQPGDNLARDETGQQRDAASSQQPQDCADAAHRSAAVIRTAPDFRRCPKSGLATLGLPSDESYVR
jgi:hypothetical protein